METGPRLTFIVTLVASTLSLAARASAGDFADLNVLGFSPDGRTFAFEEFGEYDGSGGHYSNIYLIDVNSDSWVAGTPIRVSPDDPDISLAAVRAEARKKAAPLIAKYGVVPNGHLVVSNPPTELSNNPYSVAFLTDFYANATDHVWRVTLTDVAFPLPDDCKAQGVGGNVQGFKLVLSSPRGDNAVLHEDKTLPASRGCVEEYAIAGVVTYIPQGDWMPSMVVLLNTISQGFEGPDRRYLAVATRFQDF